RTKSSSPTLNINIIPETIVQSKPNAVIYYKSMPNKPTRRAGLWEMDLSTKKETQLVSFEGISGSIGDKEKVDVYGSPNISPDKSKIAYYLGKNLQDQKDKTYSLWIYDLSIGSNKKVLENIKLKEGYIQDPVWDTKSNFLYIPLFENSRNKLYKLDLSGNKKLLASSYSGDILWPKILDNLIVFNTSLPSTSQLGVLDLYTDQVKVIDLPHTTYFANVDLLDPNTLLVSSNLILSSQGAIDQNFVAGLEKVDLKTGNYTYVKLPKDQALPATMKRLAPLLTCNKTWSILGTIEDDGKHFEKITQYILYNIQDNSFRKLNMPQSFLGGLSRFSCDDQNPSEAYNKQDLKAFTFNILNPENIRIIDFKEVLPVDLSKSCLYPSLIFPNNTFDGSNVYVQLRIGQGCLFGSNQPDQGIYKVDFKNKTSVRVSTDQDSDEDDWILTAP
ncbi:hypothetical protein KKA69_02265, partial [Patescibacteria group bacterium]|nr:hypothetical protein [Patescibacteria group bacterium]